MSIISFSLFLSLLFHFIISHYITLIIILFTFIMPFSFIVYYFIICRDSDFIATFEISLLLLSLIISFFAYFSISLFIVRLYCHFISFIITLHGASLGEVISTFAIMHYITFLLSICAIISLHWAHFSWHFIFFHYHYYIDIYHYSHIITLRFIALFTACFRLRYYDISALKTLFLRADILLFRETYDIIIIFTPYHYYFRIFIRKILSFSLPLAIIIYYYWCMIIFITHYRIKTLRRSIFFA